MEKNTDINPKKIHKKRNIIEASVRRKSHFGRNQNEIHNNFLPAPASCLVAI